MVGADQLRSFASRRDGIQMVSTYLGLDVIDLSLNIKEPLLTVAQSDTMLRPLVLLVTSPAKRYAHNLRSRKDSCSMSQLL